MGLLGVNRRPRGVHKPVRPVTGIHLQKRLERLGIVVDLQPGIASCREPFRQGRDRELIGVNVVELVPIDRCRDLCPGASPDRPGPEHVLWGAFWLKSTNTRWPRSSFHHAAVMRSGRRRSSSRAMATAALRTW